jgi:hypothetical protein
MLPSLLWLLPALPLLVSAYDSSACNSSPSLCDKSYSEILHLGTHDSAFVRTSENKFSLSANQYFPVRTQLSTGIRLLQNQIHLEGSEIRLCHTSCTLFDAGLLEDYLVDVKEWLDENPSEVVTLLFANLDKLGPDRLTPIWEKTGLAEKSFVFETEWPTLGEMVGNDTRVVTFLSDAGAPGGYFHPEFSYMFETAFENFLPEDLGCGKDRGSWGIGLMNHFLYTTISKELEIFAPNDTFAETLNSGLLEERVEKCSKEWGTKGGMVIVDFYNEGDPIAVVDKANGVENPVNREAVPDHPKEDAESEERIGLDGLVEQVGAGEQVALGAWIWEAASWGAGFGKDGWVSA